MQWLRGAGVALLILTACSGGGGSDAEAEAEAEQHDHGAHDHGAEEHDHQAAADTETPAESSGASGAGLDPCTLLVDAQIEEVTARSVDGEPEMVEQAAVGVKVCTWTVVADDAPDDQQYVQVGVLQTEILTAEQQESGTTAGTLFDQTLEVVEDEEEVEGLGSEAWFASEFGIYVVVDDDLVLNVSAAALFGGTDEAAERETTLALTEVALSNLEAARA